MKLKTALVIPVIILLSVLAITLFSYYELQSFSVFTNQVIESHAKNLILLDDLKTHTNDIGNEIQKIQNSESLSNESLSNSFSRISDAKTNLNKITESNMALDSNFLQKFSESSDILFTKH